MEISSEIPVAPPSIKWLVSKKPLNPNEAEKIPAGNQKKVFHISFQGNHKIPVNIYRQAVTGVSSGLPALVMFLFKRLLKKGLCKEWVHSFLLYSIITNMPH